jgi:hypothetical protein
LQKAKIRSNAFIYVLDIKKGREDATTKTLRHKGG